MVRSRYAERSGLPSLVEHSVKLIAVGRGGPRDLGAIRDGLAVATRCGQLLEKEAGPLGLPHVLKAIAERLGRGSGALSGQLNGALGEELPYLRRDGGFIKAGFNSDLDAARALRDDSRLVMAGLETRYAEQTGIKALKVRHNNILGFFVEVTQLNSKPLLSPPLSDMFRHRQTMANAVRFSTAELAEIEGQIASASERALNLEQDIFNELALAIADEERSLGEIAAALAERMARHNESLPLAAQRPPPCSAPARRRLASLAGSRAPARANSRRIGIAPVVERAA